MAAISIKSFGGISPRLNPRYLQDNQAQVAINCPVFAGSLLSLLGLSAPVATTGKTEIPKTIYRFGQDTISDSDYWFSWDGDVDVCRGQINGDTSEWTYFTGDGYPKATYNAIALSQGTGFPAVSRRLGLPAPTTAAIASTDIPTDTTSIPETRVYIWTWVNKESGFEFESAPSPASDSVDAYPQGVVTLSGLDAVPNGYVVTHRRIYRSTSGIFLYVGEMLASGDTFVDEVLAENLAEEIASLDWSMPPEALRGLINLPNGMMAGFVGRDVYLCEPFRPHAWPEKYIQSVDYPVMGLGKMDTALAVLTTGTPYIMQGTHPDNVTVIKADIEQSCVSKKSIVSSNGMVMYASPDGLVMLSQGGSKVVTEQLFSRAQWQEFNPSSIHAYQHDLKYVAFYDTGTLKGGFIFDLTTGIFIQHNIYAACGFNDTLRDELFIALDDGSITKWIGGDATEYVWRSKKFTMPSQIGFSCAKVMAESYPLSFRLFVDGSECYALSVEDGNAFRLPPHNGRDFEIQIEGTAEVFALAIAQSMSELAG